MKWYWLSFVDPALPEGKRSLGACYLQAEDPRDACRAAYVHRCNPGGEVQIHDITEWIGNVDPRLKPNTLYSREEIEATEPKE